MGGERRAWPALWKVGLASGLMLLVLCLVAPVSHAAKPVLVTPDTLLGTVTASPDIENESYNFLAVSSQVPDPSSPPSYPNNYDGTQIPGEWTSDAGPIDPDYEFSWSICDSQGGNCTALTSPRLVYGIIAMPSHVEAFTFKVRVGVCNNDGCSYYSILSEPGHIPTANLSPPAISGTAQQGANLSLDTPGSWQGTGSTCTFDSVEQDTICNTAALTYKWQRCDAGGSNCQDIEGQAYQPVPSPYVAPTYTPSLNDVGYTIRAMVKATGGFGAGTVETPSAASDPVSGAPFSQSSPTIELPDPTLSTGDILSASPGEWIASPTPSFSYQWQSCDASGETCSDIDGATAASFTVPSSFTALKVKVRVIATNAFGASSASSVSSDQVLGAPISQSAPSFSGTAQVGSVLTAQAGGWRSSPAASYTYAWLRCDSAGDSCSEISGASSASYTLVSADAGSRIRVRVTATNSQGSSSAESTAGSEVGASPANTSLPALSGDAVDGQLLSVSQGAWSGTPSPAFSYQWQRCDSSGANCLSIPGATSDQYTVTPGDSGRTLRARVTATNSGGASTVNSPVSLVVPNVAAAPANDSLPVINGTVKEGETVSASTGDWRGFPSPSFSYQWQLCDPDGEACGSISGATSSNYTVASATAGNTLRVIVEASNASGSISAVSAASSAIIPLDSAPVNLVSPEISGYSTMPQVGEAITSSSGSWSGYPDPSYSYQWQRCETDLSSCAAIPGAVSSSYTPTSLDDGKLLRVSVTAQNYLGSQSALSSPTPAVGFKPINTALPLISGDTEVGAILDGSDGSWQTSQEISAYAYQWQRCDSSGSGCVNIPTATSDQYLSDTPDVGKRLRLRVTAFNASGSTTATSAASSRINWAPANDALPAISGTASVGSTLSASPGNWSGEQPLTYSYRWQRCDSSGANCSSIFGATASSYLVASGDGGSTLRVEVTALNASGSSTAVSSQTATVTGAPVVISAPVVSGVAELGQTLATTNGLWAGSPTPSFSYRWQRSPDGVDWETITGATASTYLIGASDTGMFLRSRVLGDNVSGSAVAVSTATSFVPEVPSNTSSPSVDGLAYVGYVLSASPGSWIGSPAYAYQWQRCDSSGANCSNIPAATSSDYTVSDDDLDSKLRVRVTGSNSSGTGQASSAVTALVAWPPVAPVNDSLPVISGTAQKGETLSGSNGSWLGTEPFNFSYQWLRCDSSGANCSNIPAATSSTYTVVAADGNHRLRLKVTASNDAGSADSESLATSLVPPAPSNTTPPSISGDPFSGQTLTASPGVWSGEEPIGFSYQWLRCDWMGASLCTDIPAATSSTYQATSSDINYTLKIKVTASNIHGQTELISASTAPISEPPTAPVNTSAPVLSGQAEVGGSLSATQGAWSGSDPISYAYQWQRCDSGGSNCENLAGETSASYTPSAGDAGLRVRVVVTASNAVGSLSEPSSVSGRISAPPANTAVPSFSGQAQSGESLSGSAGSWSGYPSPTLSYQWQRCDSDGSGCVDIAESTSLTYVVSGADTGKKLRLKVEASNASGTISEVSSLSDLVPEPPSSPVNTVLPAISGTAQVGSELSGSQGSWSANPSPGFTYQWLSCNASGGSCEELPGESLSTYILAASDLGTTLRIRVSADNGVGSAVTATSNPSQVVEAAPEPPVNSQLPTLSGTAKQGQVLSGGDGQWSGTQPISLTRSWFACDAAGDDCQQIDGQSSASLTLASAQVGKRIKFRVAASNPAGSEDAFSELSAVVSEALPPLNTELPVVSGAARTGTLLSASQGDWSGDDPINYTYQWISCAADQSGCADISGAASQTFTPDEEYLGRRLKVRVTASNGVGVPISADSLLTEVVVAPAPPLNTSLPIISGTAKQGETLLADQGSWSGDQPISFSGRQWKRCDSAGASCQDIAGAQSATYTLTAADVGAKLRFRLLADNGVGAPVEAISEATALVAPVVAPTNTEPPSISGQSKVAVTLSSSPGVWSGDEPIALSYQWLRCQADGSACAPIASADQATYRLVASDSGKRLKLEVSASNGGGALTVGSSLSEIVAPADTPPAPIITSSPSGQSRIASFSFSGQPGAAFECAIDQQDFTACQSPFVASGLSDGAHLFKVRQQVEGSWSSLSQASFSLDTNPPAKPVIAGAPGNPTVSRSASFQFTGEDGAAFSCRLDGGEWSSCQSPYLREVSLGDHSFEVRQTDAAGNTSDSALFNWRVEEQVDPNPDSPDAKLKLAIGDEVLVSGSSGSSVATVGCAADGAALTECSAEAYVLVPVEGARSATLTKSGKFKRVPVALGSKKSKQPTSRLAVNLKLSKSGQRRLLYRAGPLSVHMRIWAKTSGDNSLKAYRRTSLTPRSQIILPSAGMFHSGQARLSRGATSFTRTMISRLPRSLKSVTCVGHTDSQGSSSLNYSLGLRRARAVCRLIRSSGVKASFKASSAGESEPRASNRSSQGRALNRRVEIKLRYR